MTGRELIRWIHENHAEDMVVHIRNTGGEDIESADPDLRCSIVEEPGGQMRTDRYIMI